MSAALTTGAYGRGKTPVSLLKMNDRGPLQTVESLCCLPESNTSRLRLESLSRSPASAICPICPAWVLPDEAHSPWETWLREKGVDSLTLRCPPQRTGPPELWQLSADQLSLASNPLFRDTAYVMQSTLGAWFLLWSVSNTAESPGPTQSAPCDDAEQVKRVWM